MGRGGGGAGTPGHFNPAFMVQGGGGHQGQDGSRKRSRTDVGQ